MGFLKMPFDIKKRNNTIHVEDTENFIEHVWKKIAFHIFCSINFFDQIHRSWDNEVFWFWVIIFLELKYNYNGWRYIKFDDTLQKGN